MKRLIIAFVAFLWLAAGCKTEVSEEIYLIPDGFIGNLIVVYGHEGGAADSIVNNKIIYKIPQSGVLYLKGHQHLQEFSRMRYYYYDANRRRGEICRYGTDSITNNCEAVVYNSLAESFQKTLNSHRYDYIVTTVGKKDSIPAKIFDPSTFNFKTPN